MWNQLLSGCLWLCLLTACAVAQTAAPATPTFRWQADAEGCSRWATEGIEYRLIRHQGIVLIASITQENGLFLVEVGVIKKATVAGKPLRRRSRLIIRRFTRAPEHTSFPPVDLLIFSQCQDVNYIFTLTIFPT